MELMLTAILAILTALLWWQAFFQNNVTLFQKRMELYQDYARKYHIFVNYADECHKHIVLLMSNDSTLNEANKEKKLNLLQKFSDLEGATSPMMFVGFSNKINTLLVQSIDDSNLITDFFTQSDKRKSKVSADQVSNALNRLENARNVDSDLNIHFQSELPLRNFRFYKKKLCLKIHHFCKSYG